MRMVTGEDSVEGVGVSEDGTEVTVPNRGNSVLRVLGDDRRSTGMRLHKVDRSTPGTRETCKTNEGDL